MIVPGGVDRSGRERVIPCLLWLIEALVDAGHDVCVFALRQEDRPARWQLFGADIHNIGWRPGTIFGTAALIAEHRRHRFDAIHSFWASTCGVIGGIAARLLGVPHVLTLAGGEISAVPEVGYGGLLTRRGRARLRVAVALADVVTAPSRWLCRMAAATGIAATHVPLGVDLRRWPRLPPRSRDPASPLRLLHVASLNRVKDQATLLAAARALRDRAADFELTIVGEDTMSGAAQRIAVETGLSDCVRFAGFLPHDALRPLVERSDLLVMTSRHEAGPLVALEAAAAGVPTVGTEVGHIADWSGDAACAVPIGDGVALADAIARIADDEPARRRLADRAYAGIAAYDVADTAAAFARMYAMRSSVSGGSRR